MLRLCIILAFFIISISALPTSFSKDDSEQLIKSKGLIQKRHVNTNTDPGSVVAATTIDATQVAIVGVGTVSKLGADTSSNVLKNVVDLTTSAGAGLANVGKLPIVAPPGAVPGAAPGATPGAPPGAPPGALPY